MDLSALLARPEGKTLEFKRDLSSPSGVLRTITAFANSAGGVLLIGIEDRTRRVRGVEQPLDVEERLANLIADSIEPRLAPGIEIVPWRRTQLVAVEVYPSPGRPHYLAREGAENGTYVRVGSTNRRADLNLIRELGRSVGGEGYDEQPVIDLDSGAIDFRFVAESFAGVRSLVQSDLETLRLIVRHQRHLVPTVGGLLLFGRDRLSQFPDAWVQAGLFTGKDRSRIADSTEIRSPLPAAAAEAVAFVERHALAAPSVGVSPSLLFAKPSSTPSFTPTTHSAGPRFVSRSSATASRSKAQGS
jgi:ATP-dependent DNA helicase RecG